MHLLGPMLSSNRNHIDHVQIHNMLWYFRDHGDHTVNMQWAMSDDWYKIWICQRPMLLRHRWRGERRVKREKWSLIRSSMFISLGKPQLIISHYGDNHVPLQPFTTWRHYSHSSPHYSYHYTPLQPRYDMVLLIPAAIAWWRTLKCGTFYGVHFTFWRGMEIPVF